MCVQCKLYSFSTNLTKADVENEISKTRDSTNKHLSRYKDRWFLVIYTTRALDFQIEDQRCIVLDSVGMERHFGPTLTERAFYLLEHRKANVNFYDACELQEVRGVGEKISALIVKEREKGAFKDWRDLKGQNSEKFGRSV
jgi:DNA uptake protein ComE-like DNA-binding protein